MWIRRERVGIDRVNHYWPTRCVADEDLSDGDTVQMTSCLKRRRLESQLDETASDYETMRGERNAALNELQQRTNERDGSSLSIQLSSSCVNASRSRRCAPRAAVTVAGVGPGHRRPPLRRTSPALSMCTVTVGTTS